MTRLRSLSAAWARGHPLLVVALAAVGGICLADWTRPPPGLGLSLAVGALGLATALAVWRRRARPWVWLPLLGLVFFTLHAHRVKETFQHPVRDALLHAAGPVEARVRGRLYPWTSGAELDPRMAWCEVTRFSWGQGEAPALPPLALKVVLPAGFVLDTPGEYELHGTLLLPRPAMNPGQFDAADYALRSGWVAMLTAREVERPATPSWDLRFHLLRGAEACRQWMAQVLARGIEADAQNTAVILAMALGASDAAGEEIEDAFRDSGTLHVFAVSGLHVVMVGVVVSFLVRWAGVGRGRAAALVIVLVFAYAYITGWRPSAARAAFMVSIYLSAAWWNRSARLQNSLGAAAVLLLAVDTHALFGPGFQLSFAVLWAIALLGGLLQGRWRSWTQLDPFLPPMLASWQQRGASGARAWAAGLLGTSLAAWAGSLPLTLAHFQTVTPIALVANMVLVPASSLCIGLSCVSITCSLLGLGPLQVLANQANRWCARFMVVAATGFASVPGATFSVPQGGPGTRAPVELRVFHLSGGGGAGLATAGERHWLLDCGGERGWKQVMRPALTRLGVRRLEGLVLTHADSAHIGAAQEALKLGMPRLYTSALEPWPGSPATSSMRKLEAVLAPDRGRWWRYAAGEVLLEPQAAGGPLFGITVLHPREDDSWGRADDRVLVQRLQAGGLRVLWLSDAGHQVEAALLERKANLECDVLVRGQNPGDSTGLAGLLHAARPRLVISSHDSGLAGQGMPVALRDSCARLGIELWETEVCGCVSISVHPERAVVESFVGGRRMEISLQSAATGAP